MIYYKYHKTAVKSMSDAEKVKELSEELKATITEYSEELKA